MTTPVFDAASEENGAGTSSPFSWSHTIGVGNDRILIVAFFVSTNAPATIGSVTFGSSTMTLLTSTRVDVTEVQLFAYYLTAPPVGVGTITVSTPAAHHFGGMAVSYFNVDQSNPLEAINTSSAITAAATVTVIIRGQLGQTIISAMAVDNRNTETDPPNPTSGSGIIERVDEWTHSGTTTQTAAGIMGEQLKIITLTTVSYDKPTAGPAVILGAALRSAINPRNRLVRYMHNTFMSRLIGRPLVLDIQGREMPLSQIEFDQWIRTDGPFFPTPRRFVSTIEDPAITYIESLNIQGDRAIIETNKDLFLENILDTLGGSS